MKFPLAIVVFGILPVAFKADSLKCVQCINCAEDWPYPEECPAHSICGKAVVNNGAADAVGRSCAPARRLAEDGRCIVNEKGSACFYACDTEGCNGSPGACKFSGLWAVLSGLVLLFLNNRSAWF